jgi:hypothetical protein
LLQQGATAPVRVSGGPSGRYGVAYRNGRRLVVAVTNDFGWVQLTDRNNVPSVINPPPPPATGIHVVWRKGHGLPETWNGFPFPRLRAVEAISGRRLNVRPDRGGYRVELPRFQSIALLVVSRSLIP